MSAGRTLRVFTYSGNPNGHMLAPWRGFLCVDYGTPPELWQAQAQGKTHWKKCCSCTMGTTYPTKVYETKDETHQLTARVTQASVDNIVTTATIASTLQNKWLSLFTTTHATSLPSTPHVTATDATEYVTKYYSDTDGGTPKPFGPVKAGQWKLSDIRLWIAVRTGVGANTITISTLKVRAFYTTKTFTTYTALGVFTHSADVVLHYTAGGPTYVEVTFPAVTMIEMPSDTVLAVDAWCKLATVGSDLTFTPNIRGTGPGGTTAWAITLPAK